MREKEKSGEKVSGAEHVIRSIRTVASRLQFLAISCPIPALTDQRYRHLLSARCNEILQKFIENGYY